jgi:hypothetical protein
LSSQEIPSLLQQQQQHASATFTDPINTESTLEKRQFTATFNQANLRALNAFVVTPLTNPTTDVRVESTIPCPNSNEPISAFLPRTELPLVIGTPASFDSEEKERYTERKFFDLAAGTIMALIRIIKRSVRYSYVVMEPSFSVKEHASS